MMDVSRFSTASVPGWDLLNGLEMTRATRTIPVTDAIRSALDDVQAMGDADKSRDYGSTDAKRAASVKMWEWRS